MLLDHTIMTFLIPLLLGWLLDLLLGDPIYLPHPVVYMGRWISFWEHHTNHGKYKKTKGACFAVTSIVLIFVLAWGVKRWLTEDEKVYILISTVFVFFSLAGHTLRKEVKLVFEALDESLDKGRKQVARIVGRDTKMLSRQEVCTAALETLAENLSDGIIAPLLWYLALGLPGMLTYKMINTMDSMIAYRTDRFKNYGCWAAHIDDIANYIPARITALLIVICGYIYYKVNHLNTSYTLNQLSKFVCHYGNNHLSPNSGWPEAALAGILSCRFGGTHSYFGEDCYKPFIGNNPRVLTLKDMHTSIKVCFRVELITIISVFILTLFIYHF